ncbi:MAG: glutamate formimidoyltransferase [Nitrososphaerales archaeon]
MKLIESVPNFSEGRRKQVISQIMQAAERSSNEVTLLDCQSDIDHNRMVLTLVGDPQAVKKAVFASSAKAVELIDLTKHSGVHPCMGAVDVVPFIPLGEATMEECIRLANEFGQEFAERFSVPVFMYERAAKTDYRRNLANVRAGQFAALRDLIGVDRRRDPDYGPRKIHPTAGATAVGARPILIAFNVDLETKDVDVAKKIAKRVRERNGGFLAVKALGFQLKRRGMVQVSTNLTDYKQTSILPVFEAISKHAEELGVRVAESEIVGLVPRGCLPEDLALLRLRKFTNNQIIENRIEKLY